MFLGATIDFNRYLMYVVREHRVMYEGVVREHVLYCAYIVLLVPLSCIEMHCESRESGKSEVPFFGIHGTSPYAFIYRVLVVRKDDVPVLKKEKRRRTRVSIV